MYVYSPKGGGLFVLPTRNTLPHLKLSSLTTPTFIPTHTHTHTHTRVRGGALLSKAMGAVMPLPERIPRPTDAEQRRLEALGLTIETCAEDARYVPISLGGDYEWVDKSYRPDIPTWYIVNKKTRAAVVRVSGGWKGSYENVLELFIDEGGFSVSVDTASVTSPVPVVNVPADSVDTLVGVDPDAARRVLCAAASQGMYGDNMGRAADAADALSRISEQGHDAAERD